MLDKLMTGFNQSAPLTELAQEVSTLEKWIEQTRELE